MRRDRPNPIRSQAPHASKLVCANYVIDKSDPLPDLTDQVERVVAKLSERAGWRWVRAEQGPGYNAKGSRKTQIGTLLGRRMRVVLITYLSDPSKCLAHR